MITLRYQGHKKRARTGKDTRRGRELLAIGVALFALGPRCARRGSLVSRVSMSKYGKQGCPKEARAVAG